MRPIRRQILTLGFGFLVFAAAVLGLAGPAAAHDAAESSTPAEGASVAVPPEQVSVTFNKTPLGIGAAFWALVVGLACRAVLHRPAAPVEP